MARAMRILVLNAGSSSLKHALIERDHILDAQTKRWPAAESGGAHAAAAREAIAALDAPPDAVGHRVVHGGERFTGPARVDAAVVAEIHALAPLAPLHNPAAAAGIEAAQAALPAVPQVACFDTAFHHTLPAAATTYALPADWRERWGVRRYGFHGINVEWCARQVDAPRLVVCHLGSGCSVTAVRDGRSVDTTMGWTPLEGVPMATRAGSVDPGILVRAARELPADALDHALNHDSGLLALAPGHADLKALLAADDAQAGAAIDVFVRGVAAAVGAMSTALGGLDALVFTAGVGEGSALVRDQVTARVAHLGDDVAVLVVPAGEERLIADQTTQLLWPR
jgi:acetate kinase